MTERAKPKIEIQPMPETLQKPFSDQFPNYSKEGWVRIMPSGLVLPAEGEGVEKVYQMQPRKEDAWIITFPKSGKNQYNTKYLKL